MIKRIRKSIAFYKKIYFSYQHAQIKQKMCKEF